MQLVHCLFYSIMPIPNTHALHQQTQHCCQNHYCSARAPAVNPLSQYRVGCVVSTTSTLLRTISQKLSHPHSPDSHRLPQHAAALRPIAGTASRARRRPGRTTRSAGPPLASEPYCNDRRRCRVGLLRPSCDSSPVACTCAPPCRQQ